MFKFFKRKSKSRAFIVGFTYTISNGFGFGYWTVETDGELVDYDDLVQYAKKVKDEKNYTSLTILSISEVHSLTTAIPTDAKLVPIHTKE